MSCWGLRSFDLHILENKNILVDCVFLSFFSFIFPFLEDNTNLSRAHHYICLWESIYCSSFALTPWGFSGNDGLQERSHFNHLLKCQLPIPRSRLTIWVSICSFLQLLVGKENCSLRSFVYNKGMKTIVFFAKCIQTFEIIKLRLVSM